MADDDKLAGTRKALDKYFSKQAKQLDREMNGVKRKNGRPEFELTVKPVKRWLDAHGFSCDVIESKAVWSPDAGRFLRGQAVEGFPDICGVAPDGIAVYIECKAPGNWRGLKPHQREFLINKIKHNAFAVCVDSVEKLYNIHSTWVNLPGLERRAYLLSALPPVPVSRKTSPDTAEMGF